MDDKTVILLAVALSVAVIILSFGLALWLVARLRRKSDQPLSQDTSGLIVVPVRQLKRTFGFFGVSKNGISPRLEIARDGLRFKVFKPDHWPFADIAQVDAPRLPFVTRLGFRNRSGALLFADLANKDAARAMLRALPASLPLTPRAVELRDAATG